MFLDLIVVAASADAAVTVRPLVVAAGGAAASVATLAAPMAVSYLLRRELDDEAPES